MSIKLVKLYDLRLRINSSNVMFIGLLVNNTKQFFFSLIIKMGMEIQFHYFETSFVFTSIEGMSVKMNSCRESLRKCWFAFQETWINVNAVGRKNFINNLLFIFEIALGSGIKKQNSIQSINSINSYIRKTFTLFINIYF